jgi:hypothetical protein
MLLRIVARLMIVMVMTVVTILTIAILLTVVTQVTQWIVWIRIDRIGIDWVSFGRNDPRVAELLVVRDSLLSVRISGRTRGDNNIAVRSIYCPI